MIVRELVASYGIDFDEKSADKADKAVSGLKQGAIVLGAAVAALGIGRMLGGMIDQFTTAADVTAKLSKRIGVSASTLQELGYAAEISGTSVNEFNTNIERFIRRTGEAADGSGEAKDAYEKLGISIRNGAGEVKDADVLIKEISDSLLKLPSRAEQAAVSADLFGRSGIQMINMLEIGSAGIQGLQDEFRTLGGVIDKDLLKSSEEWRDTLTRINAVTLGVKAVIVRAFLPAFEASAQALISVTRAILPAIQKSKLLEMGVRGLAIVMSSLAVVAGVMLAAKLGGLATTALQLAGALGAAGRSAILMQLKFAAIGVVVLILIGLIVLLAEDIYTLATGGESAIGRLAEAINGLYFSLLEDIDPEDFWLIEILKYAVQTWDLLERTAADVIGEIIRDFGRVESVTDFLGALFNAPIRLWQQTIGSFLTWLSGQFSSPLLRRILGALPAIADVVARGGGGMASGASAGGVAVTPAAVNSNASTSNTMEFKTGITVNAGPGQSPEDIAQAVGAEVDRRLQAHVAEATAAMTPAVVEGEEG